MRKPIILLFAITAVPAVWYSWLLWQNNRPAELVTTTELEAKLDLAIDWLENNQNTAIEARNPVLWWMIKLSSDITDNPRLISIFQNYKAKKIDTNPHSLSGPMFNFDITIRIPPVVLLYKFPQYNLLFFYGITCDDQLGREPEIQQQLDKEFCSMHFLHPRCMTHQLMGVRFMQRHDCGDPEQTAELKYALQNKIITELTWDPRVVDAYIQRVMVLVESGAANRVKAVWILRALEAQNMDGGWGDLDPIIRLPNERYFGLTSTGLTISIKQSDFHATAQGILLISLLLTQATGH